ncbi:MAG: Cysteine-tRNA ligase [Candidatus Yanofskybacteria bacterium GW2011_GWF1_44_227]|uniref:Cysteine--tRNA ligase n=1 Tax=Candidatus Yanofskybacteria bacterium GW2011_GWE2_40_11 TaxID=1619033 RepID=A0A0G0QJT4_9BACT|nr:MAG: Cysteine-tRNA ligase [Candidatus Yanofskybacteria bacterium GW2011_GWE1_40_10]KKR40604.1 MAG: Cysteine-tRNA ligase [Candidatus Yanofskybacteria bacterium GW2011_GWE2_40_11]KKT15598.1 MAG: Cysteine-tRNA ligase [Candidatus Yanofskybacteria bacterium GW2011_GWF2_43_596]KKT53352.1 MAG: Cysteine-tRNA ligase [Candidatus Yanofskybacteria bacterium GW2011_GWF1_44_227]OGN35979.1 MAG: cysteine--tRNA ligase [Candidatus Yanofskybacteria bacterium RIFOXYA1_FULL_44_17]OGN36419.1 MAG: cysteine--tRNA 
MPDIFLYDTYSREKKEFKSLEPMKVAMYSCGPTVYDYPHIGNLRAYVFSDLLRRTLKYNGFEVNQVMNITDVGHLTSDGDDGEDKIEQQAEKTGKTAQEISQFFTNVFIRDLAMLNIVSPATLVKATSTIDDQIKLIEKLEILGYTYKTSDGIYYDTSKFKDYGHMANLNKDAIKPGARVELNQEKRNQTDFALWKFSPQNIKRQMEWESPWGVGFPGWHIECSAMAMKFLGDTIDIHTGGIDHINIHHTNEIAQSEAATGKQFVRYWMHNAFLLVEGKKMSKSLGTVFTLEDLFGRGYDPLVFRYLMLTAHYRSEMNFTWESLSSAKIALDGLRKIIAGLDDGGISDEGYVAKFREIVNNDVDAPRGLALAWEVAKSDLSSATKKATLLDFDKVLGLKLSEVSVVDDTPEVIPDEVVRLAEEREEMRKSKNWSAADAARQKILDLGYTVDDAPDGYKIKKQV